MESTQEIEQATEQTSMHDDMLAMLNGQDLDAEEPEQDQDVESEANVGEDLSGEDGLPEGEEATEAAEVGEVDSDAIEPPNSMTAEQKEYFATLDREAQEFLASQYKNMQGNFTKKTTELAEERKTYEAIESALSPVKQQIEQLGIDEATAISGLVGEYQKSVHFVNWFRQNPMAAIQQLAMDTETDISNLDFSDFYIDPNESRARQLERQVQDIPNQIQNGVQQQMRQQQAISTMESAINDFMNATDASGNPKHPHFAELEQDMMPYIRQVKTKEEAMQLLDDAYQRALWANPQTREKALQKEQQAARAKDISAKKAKAKQAKKAGTPIKGVSAATGSDDNLSLEETLRAELSARLG